MKQPTTVKKYYDEWVPHQLSRGINLRHLSIFRLLKKWGLKPTDRVLEIGCGVGPVSELIARYLSTGTLVGTDISSKSIEAARQNLGDRPNIEFVVTDMKDFTWDEEFDTIVLPDVLEHIPIEDHPALFRMMFRLLDSDGFVLIHIPDPNFLDWKRSDEPESLQIIDQSIQADQLCRDASAEGFELMHLSSYPVFYETPDYRVIVFRKANQISSPQLQSKLRRKIRTIIAKVWW